MPKPPEIHSSHDATSELTERVVSGATQIADTLEGVDGETRTALLRAAAEVLEPLDATVVDLHEMMRSLPADFDPDSLPGKVGLISGRTRAQVLAGMVLRTANPRRIRRP